MAKQLLTIDLPVDKICKSAVRFAIPTPERTGVEPADNIYIKKFALPEPLPQAVRVTVEALEDGEV